MTSNVGTLSPVGDDGFRRLILPGVHRVVQVEADVGDDALAVRFGLDGIVRMPVICSTVHLDGPLAGQTGYTVNEIGYRTGFALPPRPGGPTGIYEVVKLSEDGQPAETRLVDVQQSGAATARRSATLPDVTRPASVRLPVMQGQCRMFETKGDGRPTSRRASASSLSLWMSSRCSQMCTLH